MGKSSRISFGNKEGGWVGYHGNLTRYEAARQTVPVWNSVYDAIYRLWLASGEYEAWAKDQLLDIQSPVNKRGPQLNKDLNDIRRCYYWYFQDQSEEDFEPATRCPNCGQKFTIYQNGIYLQYICEGCRIITVAE